MHRLGKSGPMLMFKITIWLIADADVVVVIYSPFCARETNEYSLYNITILRQSAFHYTIFEYAQIQ